MALELSLRCSWLDVERSSRIDHQIFLTSECLFHILPN
jgi:hypothetical protein